MCPRVSYLMVSAQTLKDARFKIKVRQINYCHINGLCRQKYRYHSRSKEDHNLVHYKNEFYFEFTNESKVFP